MYVIEDNIEIPKRVGRQNDASFSGTMRRLQVGQSFFAAGKKSNSAVTASAVARREGRVPPAAKYVVRIVTEDGVQGVRLWRVA